MVKTNHHIWGEEEDEDEGEREGMRMRLGGEAHAMVGRDDHVVIQEHHEEEGEEEMGRMHEARGEKESFQPAESRKMISVRIVSQESYMSKPIVGLDATYSSFSGCSIEQVPVVRIFGTTPGGQKVCLHLHKCFPYFFLEYDESIPLEHSDVYIHKLAASIERAMDLSLGSANFKRSGQYIYKITLGRAKSFYGFHPCDKIFLKVFVYNPNQMTRIVNLLRTGAIMGQQFQPYESHIPFLLQVFIDCNLYGMNFVHLKTTKFRTPILKRKKFTPTINLSFEDTHIHDAPKSKIWKNENTTPEDFSFLPRTSSCELEIDSTVEDIVNIDEIVYTPLSEIDSADADISKSKIVQSLAGIWQEERARRKMQGENEEPIGWTQDEVSEAKERPDTTSVVDEMIMLKLQNLIEKDKQKLHLKPSSSDQFGVINEVSMSNHQSQSPNEFNKAPALNSPFLMLDSAQVKSQASFSSFDEIAALANMAGDEMTPSDGVAPEIDEQLILSQEDSDDQEMQDILNWMQDQPDEDEDERDVTYSQRERNDIVASNQILAAEDNLCENDDDIIPQLDGHDDSPRTKKRPNDSLKRLPYKRFCTIVESGFTPPNFKEEPIARNKHKNPAKEKEKEKKEQKIKKKVRFADQLIMGPSSKEGVYSSTMAVSTKSYTNDIAVEIEEPVVIPVENNNTQRDDLEENLQETSELIPTNNTGDQSQFLVPATQFTQEANVRNSFKFALEEEPLTPNTYKLLEEAARIITNDEFSASTSSAKWDNSFKPPVSCKIFAAATPPPKASYLVETIRNYELFPVVYPNPFYGKKKDVPQRPKVFGGTEYRVGSTPTIATNYKQLKEFAPQYSKKIQPYHGIEHWKSIFSKTVQNFKPKPEVFVLPFRPPSGKQIATWLSDEKKKIKATPSTERKLVQPNMPLYQRKKLCKTQDYQKLSQIEGGTPKYTQRASNQENNALNERSNAGLGEHGNQHLTIASVEVSSKTRCNLLPNPNLDELFAIFLCVYDDDAILNAPFTENFKEFTIVFLLQTESEKLPSKLGLDCKVLYFSDEKEMLRAFINSVKEIDPDILLGYEVQQNSIGYLIERGNALNIDVREELGRVSSFTIDKKQEKGYTYTHSSNIVITGRIVLNVWRIMRSELKTNIYTRENVIFNVLNLRVPHYSHQAMTKWMSSPSDKWRVIDHYVLLTFLNIQMLVQLDIFGRTSEMARVFGIDFFSVLSRGSQYRVESMVMRMTKPQNYVLISPSRSQVAHQNAPECLPLVMEPLSQLYNSPVLVLDFQSLYPSIIIAYNICYSTCLGKMTEQNIKNLGISTLKVPNGLLAALDSEGIIVTPNEVMFTKPSVRCGVLPRLLSEILETRVMVKKAMKMKNAKNNKLLQRMLDARQYGLKMIANVTYGYTSATFSGRMPCVDIADAIVQTARETLEGAIRIVNQNSDKWNAQVVYGDTDSLFVVVPGASRKEAFRIGNEIAKQVTNANPWPVKLQFEKVYHPSVLVTKKRYVGYKWDSPDQSEPSFDAKGIETVRRDTCSAVSKIMEKSIRMLFETQDLSSVKDYLQRQWKKILSERISLQDFVFAKEVRLGSYSDRVPPPPAALVCLKQMASDPRAEPQYGERVPYVVIAGGPNARLMDLVVPPHQLISNPNLRLNSSYYITKQIIPALERVFNLVGADVKSWYFELPNNTRVARRGTIHKGDQNKQKSVKTIDEYYVTKLCVSCGKITQKGLCPECSSNKQHSYFKLLSHLKRLEMESTQLVQICASCSNAPDNTISCDSLDCSVFYERTKAQSKLSGLHELLADADLKDLICSSADPWN